VHHTIENLTIHILQFSSMSDVSNPTNEKVTAYM
jgi:hypothetical protein